MIDFRNLDNRIVSSEIEDSCDTNFELLEKKDGEISRSVKSCFITFPTKYEVFDKVSSGRILYIKNEKQYNNPVAELAKKTVDEAGGYDFLDKNYLAIITNTITHEPKFHMAVSRDKNNRDVVYIALQMTDEYCRILEDNLGSNVTDKIKDKFITINGLKYQLLPPIYVVNDATPEVKKAFENLVGKREVVDGKEVRTKGIVLRDVEEYLKKEAENPEKAPISHGYVLYDSLEGKSDCTLTLADKYGQLTGRLERYGSDAEGNPTNTKYTSLKVFLSESEEWKHRKKGEAAKAMRIGVLVGSAGIDVKFSRADHFAQITVDVNRITREKKQGSVYIMVLKPDGRYYPLMCKRKSIKKWLESKENQDILEKVVFWKYEYGEHKNEYLEEVISLVKTMLDSKKDIGQRIHAKTSLSEYINIRKENDTDPYPINIDAFNEGVKLIVEGKEYLYKINDKNPTLEDLTMAFIKGLAEKLESRAIFTIPMGSSKITEDIVDADVLEINLNGFYNFNSSLNFTPIDIEKNNRLDDKEALSKILNGEKVFKEEDSEETGTQGGEGAFNEGTDSERWYIREELDDLDEDVVEGVTSKSLARSYKSISDEIREKAEYTHKYLHEKGAPIRISSFDVFCKLVEIGLDDDDVSVEDFKTAFENFMSSIENDTHCKSKNKE